MVLGTGEKDILFYFGDQANNGTGIHCEGLVPDIVTPPAFNSSQYELSVPLIPLYG